MDRGKTSDIILEALSGLLSSHDCACLAQSLFAVVIFIERFMISWFASGQRKGEMRRHHRYLDNNNGAM